MVKIKKDIVFLANISTLVLYLRVKLTANALAYYVECFDHHFQRCKIFLSTVYDKYSSL